jgi:stage III sporulation protein SpoIIIAA
LLQHEKMIEFVPEDEIGTETGVRAAASIASRGVVLVATVHATCLRQAVYNPVLQPLFGDTETAPVSDETSN